MKPTSPSRSYQTAVLRVIVCVALTGAFTALGQGQPSRNETIFKRSIRPEKKEAAPEGEGVAFSSVIRDTDPPYKETFRDLTLGGAGVAKLGPSGSATFHGNFFNQAQFRNPFSEGTRPEEAELKFHNFYLDITALSGGLVYSDNINRSDLEKDDGIVAVTRLHFGLGYQLGENLKLSVQSALVYLPLTGKVGIAGFALGDPFIEFFPLGALRLAYDLNVGDWNVELYESAVIRQRPLGIQANYDILEGETFDERDVAGRYRTQSANDVFSGVAVRDQTERFDSRPHTIENVVGVNASRMLPTQTEMTVGAYHRNLWYEDAQSAKLPTSIDAAFVNLISERETMRFKPFFGYRTQKQNTRSDWNHTMRGGARGPITDYLFFVGDAGLFLQPGGKGSSSEGTSHLLWRLQLEHNPTPYLLHRLTFSRDLTEPRQQLQTGWTYQIRYKLRDNVFAEAFGSISQLDDLETNSPRSDELRGGVRVTDHLSDALSVSISGWYTKFGYDHPVSRHYDTWTGRLHISYQISQTFNAQVVYQYETRDASSVGPVPYTENLIMAQLVKYF